MFYIAPKLKLIFGLFHRSLGGSFDYIYSFSIFVNFFLFWIQFIINVIILNDFFKTGYEIFCRVALEKGKRLDPHDDPIHDQSSYLDGNLRTRLYQEYGVRGSYLYFWKEGFYKIRIKVWPKFYQYARVSLTGAQDNETSRYPAKGCAGYQIRTRTVIRPVSPVNETQYSLSGCFGQIISVSG